MPRSLQEIFNAIHIDRFDNQAWMELQVSIWPFIVASATRARLCIAPEDAAQIVVGRLFDSNFEFHEYWELRGFRRYLWKMLVTLKMEEFKHRPTVSYAEAEYVDSGCETPFELLMIQDLTELLEVRLSARTEALVGLLIKYGGNRDLVAAKLEISLNTLAARISGLGPAVWDILGIKK